MLKLMAKPGHVLTQVAMLVSVYEMVARVYRTEEISDTETDTIILLIE